MNLGGKVAIVTGGASGLGRAAAEFFVRAKGMRVAIFDRGPAGETVARELGPDRAVFHAVDVSDDEAVSTAVAVVADRFGAIHVCLNAAGVPGVLRIVDRDGVSRSAAAFRDTVMVNLVGTFQVMAHCVGVMARNEGEDGEKGVVVNVASIAAFEGQHGNAGYSASKAGVVGMTLPAARELARLGIRVNTIAPGLFMTNMAAGLDDRVLDSMRRVPQFPARPGHLDEFASLAAYMCENPYLNGECIRLDAAARLPAR